MKYTLLFVFLAFIPNVSFSQSRIDDDITTQKGRMYFYWGWNRGWYSDSNINYTGKDYDFTLNNVVGKDRQSKLSLDTYFNPTKFSIPQYNFRVGYFLKENWDVSFGIDHMKYVVQQNQSVEISGHIDDTQSKYFGVYSHSNILIQPSFLKFEHTDGLNYVNIELRHTNKILDFGKIKINVKEGLGLGFLLPKTNTTLLEKDRYDEFHLAGYGVSGVVGINITFLNCFFVQSEFKEGFINLPDIRTTNSKLDRASQSFTFSQLNIVFGGSIDMHHKKNKVVSKVL